MNNICTIINKYSEISKDVLKLFLIKDVSNTKKGKYLKRIVFFKEDN